MDVAIVHDYLTQRGGAERVVVTLARAFPRAPVYTSLYDPGGTFPEFAGIDVRTLPINHVGLLRRHHRAALPLLALSFSQLQLSADVVICSSSGWAHGVHVKGRKVVYCHTPARWLYQADRYLRGRRRMIRAAARLLQAPLERWDKEAAASADLYLANSSVVAKRIESLYGVRAEVISPPPAITPNGPSEEVEGIESGFILCVSRLLPYKNVDIVVEAARSLPHERLVIAGSGPWERELRASAAANVRFVGAVSDAQLRWLYANCRALVAASYEDFGMTPLEAATFGKPTAALRWGGFLDTIDEQRTGVFFDHPNAEALAHAIHDLRAVPWQATAIKAHSARFSEPRFAARISEVVLASSNRV